MVVVAEGGIYYIHVSRRDAAAAYRKKQRELAAERLRRKFEKETPKDNIPEETLLQGQSELGNTEVSPSAETLRQRFVRPVEEEVT